MVAFCSLYLDCSCVEFNRSWLPPSTACRQTVELECTHQLILLGRLLCLELSDLNVLLEWSRHAFLIVYLFCELIVSKLDLAYRLLSFSISKLIIHSMTLYSLERSNTTSMLKKMKFTSDISYLQLEEHLCRWTRPSGRWRTHRVHWGAAVGSTLKIYKIWWYRVPLWSFSFLPWYCKFLLWSFT